jgi:hypothetical protein
MKVPRIFRRGFFAHPGYVAPNRFVSHELPKKPKGSENRRTNVTTQPPPLPSNRCPRCGVGIQANAKFCYACGAPIHKTPG